ncbi:phosphatase PAP2 family protein [Haloferula sargassicola]|uniref:Phosphatidic acid phosphatase type 2/haloperoxidase domain-containing protein n=1 Tax=Haloferula sargassicola TaxID=490096 RepID=A0ABP9UPI1_9BACT
MEAEIERRAAWMWRNLRRHWTKHLMALAALAGVVGFFEIAEEVGESETRQVDETILLAMRETGDPQDPIGPPGLTEAARDITSLGGGTLLTCVTFVACGMTLLAGNRRLAALGVVSVCLGTVAMKLLKIGYDRPRPDLVEHGALVTSPSFPSGHSMMSALVYLSLGILVSRIQPRRRVRAFVMAVSIGVTLAVGLSRVFLGVHWPTDVLAGWALGGAWAMLVWIAAGLMEGGRVASEI